MQKLQSDISQIWSTKDESNKKCKKTIQNLEINTFNLLLW
jgi:hypothetical protein